MAGLKRLTRRAALKAGFLATAGVTLAVSSVSWLVAACSSGEGAGVGYGYGEYGYGISQLDKIRARFTRHT